MATAPTCLVFQVCLAASATNSVVSFTALDITAAGGRLRSISPSAHGSASSVSTTRVPTGITTARAGVIAFVAYGIIRPFDNLSI